jgi:undecaprenyl-diphosphatase
LLVIVIVVASAWWWLRYRTLKVAGLLTGSYLLTAGVVSATKRLLARPEPYEPLEAIGRSFPSGHTAAAIVVWGGIALAYTLSAPKRAAARFVTTMAITIIVIVASTMVVRSSHWLSDVVAGACVGTAALATVAAMVGSLRTNPRAAADAARRSE